MNDDDSLGWPRCPRCLLQLNVTKPMQCPECGATFLA
ncbi:ribosomal protein S27AE [Pseudoclavibacter helvolus]|uniref:Ribosomal protein S27AE n=1 Tax=Pseudoclavibacter helvolus TaxID=255205 RepID=A0A7W4URY7_9MICO|nr:ribosomal protein S27AE [Pseudoclavibacter helvolus]